MSNANIIVLSNDYKMKITLLEKLRVEPAYTLDINTISVMSAQTKFVKNTPNILIIDTDAYDIELKTLKMMMEKHMLYVITLSRRVLFNDPGITFVMKPAAATPEGMASMVLVIIQKIKLLVNRAPTLAVKDLSSFVDARQKIIAIASSTGGTEALPVVLPQLPKNCPPVLIVQHMPSIFTKQLADRIDKMSVITVKEAQDGELIRRGTAYIAPGDLHMRMVVRQQRLALECFYGDKMHGVRPAADILFDSVSRISGANAVGVILTGMGSDGARGLVEMHKKGAVVIGQNKETCVVYGMPKAAFELGAVDYQEPLGNIAKKIIDLCG